MIMAILMKENSELGPAYSFRALVHYCYGGKHGSVQTDLEELRVLHLRPQATEGNCVAHSV